jgi:hypothetical protein
MTFLRRSSISEVAQNTLSEGKSKTRMVIIWMFRFMKWFIWIRKINLSGFKGLTGEKLIISPE